MDVQIKTKYVAKRKNLQVFSLLKFPDLSFLQLFPPRPAEKRN